MTDLEWIELSGLLFFAWISGYSIGFMICYLRKFLEKI